VRGSIVGSGMAHVLVLIGALILRPHSSYVVPGPDVVQVALVDPSPSPAPAPEVKPPEPKPVPSPEIKPAQETGVKLEPAPARKKKEEKKTEERPPAPVAAPALPGARVGPAGLRGELAVDTGNFEFTYYLVLVRNMIAANWAPPAGLSTGGNPVRAVVYFRVGRGGQVSGVRIESPSGAEFFDRSTLRAVALSDPLPPLPLGFAAGDLGVHFGFEWESP